MNPALATLFIVFVLLSAFPWLGPRPLRNAIYTVIVVLVLVACVAWFWFVYVPSHRRETIPPPGSVHLPPDADHDGCIEWGAPEGFIEWLEAQKRMGRNSIVPQEEVDEWLEKLRRDYPHLTRERVGRRGVLKQESKTP